MIDTSGYLPSAARASAEQLSNCGLYCFVASISVFAEFSRTNSEDGAVAALGDLPDDEVTNESYGPLKALCEDVVRNVFDGRALIVRPGLIVGPHDDPTGRFTYWPHRIAQGGEVLAPGPADRLTQVIDVRDLGEWMVSMCESGANGTFNATHPGFSWFELVETCQAVSRSDAEITWVPDAFLVEHEVGEWMELPLWIADPTMTVALDANVSRAVEAGLTFRSLDETVRDTLEHAETTDAAGLSPEREAALLTAWHGRE